MHLQAVSESLSRTFGCNLTNSTQSDDALISHCNHGIIIQETTGILIFSKPTLIILTESPKTSFHSPRSTVYGVSLLFPASNVIAQQLPPLIQTFIRNNNDTTISIHIDPNSTINDLKQSIFSIKGFPVHRQRLISSFSECSGVSRLSELCVTGDWITLLGRLMGGNPEDNPKIMPVTWWLGFGSSY